MTFRQFTGLLFAALLLSITAEAEEWIDVTSSYIQNPNFDNNDLSGWSGTAWGAYNQKENAEHYSMTYDTYQQLTGLTPGKYRLSVKAFYRMGSASNDYSYYSAGTSSTYRYAQLYATSSSKDYYTQVQCASQGKTSSSLGGGTSTVGWMYYIPNNMEAAYYWFNAGYYNNTVECEVGSDGFLKIGIRKSSLINEDWTCCDSWKLEYYGTVTNATSITLSTTTVNMVVSETKQLTATVLPENATYKAVTWSSGNTSVATVSSDGTVTAVSAGTAVITAKAKDSGGVTATCTVTVTQPAKATAENLVINEIMAANIDVYRDPSTNFGSWVELYNPTDQGVKLGGLYVTDTSSNLKKHRLIDSYGALGAHDFAILNFDHFTNFTKESYRQIDDKLDASGGTIYITDGTSILVQQTYPEAKSRISYARTADGVGDWALTGTPTPGASNVGSVFATSQLAAPVVDTAGKLFSGRVSFNVTIPDGATLRYTTDGTTPTLTNGKTATSGAFSTTSTTCYRFRFFQDGYLPSPVTTRSFIANSGNEPFPIISLTTADGNVFNGDMAIFGQSSYGRPGNGQSSNCNWNMDWDRPVNFEYIPAATTTNAQPSAVFSQECNISSCGGWSRAYTPHSFKLKAHKSFDDNKYFPYAFFSEKPHIKSKVLQIRNGGNDNGCRIKDAALQEIAGRSGLYVERQSWQPVHVYLNGQSYAVLNMREPNNKDYGESNYGIDTDEMDQFEMSPDSGYVQMKGTKDAFNRLYNLSKTASTAASYAEIEKLLDIDEYINYMATEFYLCSFDWPQNNVKAFRDTTDGKFRFVIFDLDGSFANTSPFDAFFNKQNYTFNSLYGYDYSTGKSIAGTYKSKEIEIVTLFKNLLNNTTFRKKFIDAFCVVAGSVFDPERVKTIVNEVSSYEGQGSYVWPSSTANDIINNLGSSHQTTLISALKAYSGMGLSSTAAQTVSLASNIDGASILVNTTEVPTGTFSGQLFAPVTLTAKAPAGYVFKGWQSASGTTTGTTVFSTNSAWKYYDSGSLDSKDWKSVSYAETNWKSGNAPLGYGKT